MHEARLPATPLTSLGIFRFTGARLIDGSGDEPVENAEVVVDGDRVAYAGPYRAGNVVPGAIEVDLAGKTIMPGFIDTHVHLASGPETPPEKLATRFDSEKVLGAAKAIHATLMAGITTARDLGGLDAGYRRAIADGIILGPRLHLAIALISPTGGHADPVMSNGHGCNEGDSVRVVDSDDELRTAVRELIRAEADVIKVCTTGGMTSPTSHPQDLGVPEHQVRIVKEETARRAGQPVAAHAQGTEGILEAIRGGIDSIEHGYGIDEEGIALMLEKGTFLVPTLSTALPPRPANAQTDLHKKNPADAWTDTDLRKKKLAWFRRVTREGLGNAIRAGVKVAMGTDAGVCPHGENLKELACLVELGLTPLEAITAGTKNAAELLRLDAHLGTLQAGKLADLVVTDVDPLADISLLSDPASIGVIIQGGRLVKDLKGWLPIGTTAPAITG